MPRHNRGQPARKHIDFPAVSAFDHDAKYCFGTRGSQQNPSGLAQQALDVSDRLNNFRLALPVKSTWRWNIDQYLGKKPQIAAQRRECGAARPDRGEHLQRGNNSVSGGVLVQADDVPRVLAAQGPAPLLHEFQDVAVADPCPSEVHAHFPKRQFQGEIGHQGARHPLQG